MYFIIIRDEKKRRFITDQVSTLDKALEMKATLHKLGEPYVYIAKLLDIEEDKRNENKEA